jgi:hypothetical protein
MLHMNRPPEASRQASDETEVLVPDPRSRLTPSQIVERKLAALLDGRGLGLSFMVIWRRSSRDQGAAPTPVSWRAQQKENETKVTLSSCITVEAAD